ncbi:protein SYM1 isoform X10 [Elaeis guineensis]|uniref:PXMP2/4 family protein 4 isoform X1 n=1 Tax=Elaeis guineensis var. tenera TaxID=51953 RepID=A0A6J0PJY8_ELAGV|nr:PXMP2/4 family protein 4 isoform X1 [Elaeis guineensis]
MLKLWRWYRNCLAVHPVKTQMISSGFLWGLGDIGAQTVTHSTLRKQHQLTQQEDKELKINWKRVAITSTFGFAYDGPVGHYWYEYLDYYIRVRLQLQPKSFKFVTAKVAADGLLCGPLDLLIFFSYMGFASGKSMDQVKEDVKKDFLPALLVEAGVWPFVQVANFRFVPVRYQLLYVNFFCLLDSTFLSWIEQQADAPWKKWFAPIVTLEDQKGQA